MKENKDILNNLKKSEKPDVPEGFFADFSSDLMAKINTENTSHDDDESFLNEFKKPEKPTVPTNFFNDFPSQMGDLVKDDSSGKGRTIRLYTWALVCSAAAVLAVIFWIDKDDSHNEFVSTENEIIDNTITDEDYDTYLTYVDEGEIIDYILDNEIDFEDDEFDSENDEIYDYLGYDFEELYLEL